MKRVAIYLRVSTSKQDTDNQRRELLAVAARSGWDVVRVYEDAGISGAKGRDKRRGLDAMLKAGNAREFDMVAAWSGYRAGQGEGYEARPPHREAISGSPHTRAQGRRHGHPEDRSHRWRRHQCCAAGCCSVTGL